MTIPLGSGFMGAGELKQRGRSGSGYSSSSSGSASGGGDRSSVSSLSNDEFGGGGGSVRHETRIAIKYGGGGKKGSPESIKTSYSSESERTVSFRPKMMNAVSNMSFRSAKSDVSIESEFASLTGIPPSLSGPAGESSSARSRGLLAGQQDSFKRPKVLRSSESESDSTKDGDFAWRARNSMVGTALSWGRATQKAGSGKQKHPEQQQQQQRPTMTLSSSSRGASDSHKRNPLRLGGGVSGVTIVEEDDDEGADGANFAAESDDARLQREERPFTEDFNSYHLSYLLGVKAGARAAAEGNVGGETTDSGWEGGRRRAAGGGAAGGGGAGRQEGGDGNGDGDGGDVYWLGYRHGREHGGAMDQEESSVPYDLETGQPLTIDERIANLTRLANDRIYERESYWDTPSSFEQLIINTCCLRGISKVLCCQRGCFCFNSSIADMIWVAACALGSVAGFVVFLTTYGGLGGPA